MAFRAHGQLKDTAYLIPTPPPRPIPSPLPQEALSALPMTPKDLISLFWGGFRRLPPQLTNHTNLFAFKTAC